MRDSCTECARKHIAEAEVLMREAVMGYPAHAWLAVGHMAQAEAELISEFPEMSHIIRAERINYLESLTYERKKTEGGDIYLDLTVSYAVDTINLIEQIILLDLSHNEQS